MLFPFRLITFLASGTLNPVTVGREEEKEKKEPRGTTVSTFEAITPSNHRYRYIETRKYSVRRKETNEKRYGVVTRTTSTEEEDEEDAPMVTRSDSGSIEIQ